MAEHYGRISPYFRASHWTALFADAYVEHYRQRSRNRRYRLHLEHWDEDALNLVCFCYLVGYRGLSRIQNFHGFGKELPDKIFTKVEDFSLQEFDKVGTSSPLREQQMTLFKSKMYFI